MAVIVKSVLPPANTSDEIITAWLTSLLGTVSWPQFEAATDGNLIILDIKFKMRIGQFMKQPMQAIIACEQFICMRQRPDLKDHELKIILADDPDQCLYDNGWMPPKKEIEKDFLHQQAIALMKLLQQQAINKNNQSVQVALLKWKDELAKRQAQPSQFGKLDPTIPYIKLFGL